MFETKRIYEAPEASDGCRVLVDRLWPRGVSHEKAALDDWLKESASSPALRTWFGHDPTRFAEFSARYQAELRTDPAVKQILELQREHKTIAPLYAAHDPNCNHAIVLQEFLLERKDS